MNKMFDVERRVARLLDENPALRNNDESLIREYRRKYDGHDIPEPKSPVTSSASIIRARQKLQERGFFLPTDPEIVKKRRRQKVKMKRYALRGS